VVLSCPSLGVDLSSTGSCWLLLLVGLLLIWEKLHSWLWRRHSHRDNGDGLDDWSALGDLCIDDGVCQGHHVAPSGAEGSETPFSTRGGDVLTRGLLEGGALGKRHAVGHTYEYGIRVSPLGGETQAAKVIDDELQAAIVDGIARS
jgi:hypothetical protein